MGFTQTWTVQLPGRIPVSSSDSRRVKQLNDHGIYVQVSSPRMSQMVFNGTVPVHAIVKCIAIANESDTEGNQVEVRIYGKMQSMECGMEYGMDCDEQHYNFVYSEFGLVSEDRSSTPYVSQHTKYSANLGPHNFA